MKLLKRVAETILPRTLEGRLRDRRENHRRRRPAPHRGLETLGLSSAQVYPSGVNFDTALTAGLRSVLSDLTVRPATPVASLGSCFADEFAHHMRRAGFNYVRAETESLFPASANWGRVYTIPAFRQIARYSTDLTFPVAVESGPTGWFDPLRELGVGQFPDRASAEAAIRAHRAASRAAFGATRVLFLTLGQNEAWIDHESGLVWAQRPPEALLARANRRFAPTTFTFEEDVTWLEEALTTLRELSPNLDIVLTVSPVASHATFCGREVVTQSFAAKAVLRAVVDRVTSRLPRVWYFPALEMALAYNPHSLAADNRHVTRATVDRIFALFDATVVHPDPTASRSVI